MDDNNKLIRHWLILDVASLCNRAFYAMPKLNADDVNTGVIYAFFRDIVDLMERYRTQDIVFCFDAGKNLRNNIFPTYKQKRKENRTPEELKARETLHEQMKMLRKMYLKRIGFTNVFYQLGFEADDVIAQVCKSIGETDTATIVSTDHDLWQLLRKNINQYDPKTQKSFTSLEFKKKYGFPARKWALVKELGGCTTDEVPGCAPGIGEGRAVSYVQGKLKGKYLEAVEAATVGRELNRRLTVLPFEGTKEFVPTPGCQLSEEGWWDVCEELKFASMLKKGRLNPFSTMMETVSNRRKEYMRENKTRNAPF